MHAGDHWHVTDARWDLADGNRLASLSEEQRESLEQIAGAEQLESFQHRLVLVRRLYGEHTPRYAQLLEDLATFSVQGQGNLLAARPPLERCLAIRKQTLGEDHPKYVRTLQLLAMILRALGEPEAARPLLEKAIALSQSIHGEDTVEYGVLLQNLARVLRELGLSKDAVSFDEKALDLVQRHRGESDPDTQQVMISLALGLQARRDYAGARRLLEKVVELRRKGRNRKPIDYAMSLSLLAHLRGDQGSPEAGDALAREAMQVLGVTTETINQANDGVMGILAARDRAQAPFRRRELERRLVEVERLARDGKPKEAVRDPHGRDRQDQDTGRR